MTLAYSVFILPFTPLYTWVFEMHGEPFSYSRFSQQIVLLLLPLHGFPTFPILLLSILLLVARVCTVHLLLSQCCFDKKLYFPAFLGTIHCTYLKRPVGSLLSSIVFCQLLWHFHYLLLFFLSLSTILGYMALLSIYKVCSISSSFSVYFHCIRVFC